MQDYDDPNSFIFRRDLEKVPYTTGDKVGIVLGLVYLLALLVGIAIAFVCYGATVGWMAVVAGLVLTGFIAVISVVFYVS